jgi:hypothetical protein
MSTSNKIEILPEVTLQDDFLSIEEFKNLEEEVKYFHWEYMNGTSGLEDEKTTKDYQFVHMIYCNHHPVNDSYRHIFPILKKIDPEIEALIRIKANLHPRQSKLKEHDWHIDCGVALPGQTTAVLYLNDSDGYTMFESGDKIESKANRFVEFPSWMNHLGTNCTWAGGLLRTRVILNFNYIKNGAKDTGSYTNGVLSRPAMP